MKDGTTGDNGKKLDGHITNEEYLTCIKIWNEFNVKDMSDYHEHYLKKDVLLLADVFEKFVSMCLKFYKLDPCQYFSSPGLSWDAMLKMTVIELEKNCNIDMYLFIERGLRGGISYVCKRFSRANNKEVEKYDLTKPSKYITYLDENNLYGRGMSQYLPFGRFKWLKNVDDFAVNSISEKSSIGFIFKVDLEYPEELYELHRDHPLASENFQFLMTCCEIIVKFQIWVTKLVMLFITEIFCCIFL